MKKLMQILVLSVSVLFCNVIMAEPTVKEIFQIAQTNKEQALKMIDQVIDAHPTSAKAYFVKSELLLSMKRIPEARIAYNHADKLDSTFGYVDSGTLAKVRNTLGIKQKSESISTQNIIIVCGIIIGGIVIIWLIVRKRQTQSQSYMPTNYMNRPITPFHPSPSNTPSAPVQSGGATSGSGIMGSLATGATVGAGAVAGAALANHLINGNHSNNNDYKPSSSDSSYTPDSNYGVSDSSSWDSSSDDSSSSDDNNW